MSEANIHSGHRQRMRQRVIDYGSKTLNDHELLEMLLYHCFPRKDTNPIGHKLINEYGNLYEVFRADYRDIMDKCDMTENAALFFTLMNEAAKRIILNRWQKGVALNSSDKAGEYCIDLLSFERVEAFCVICLDAGYCLINTSEIACGSAVSVGVDPRQIAEIVLRYKAAGVMVVHNHPGGDENPSIEDIRLTKRIIDTLVGLEVEFVDHIIVSGEKKFSFADNLLFERIERGEFGFE